MHWIILILAGLFEVAFAFCLGKTKETTGSELVCWYSGFFFCALTSFLLLMYAIRNLPIGTAYAIWTGIGAVGTVVVGIIVFKEPATFWRMFFITTLVVSIIGLKIVAE